MKVVKKVGLVVAVWGSVACGLSGCARRVSDARKMASPPSATTETAATTAPQAQAMDMSAAPGRMAVGAMSPAGGEMEMPGMPGGAMGELGGAMADLSEKKSSLPVLRATRKMIFTAEMTLVVDDFRRVHERIAALAEEMGGYVDRADLSLPTEGRHSGLVTVRVPQNRFEQALKTLRTYGKVVTESRQAADVTQQYVDLDARIRNYKAQEERLLSFLRNAKTVKDTLMVDERLTAVRGQIEQLEAQMRALQAQIDLSTIIVSLEEKATVMRQPESKWVWMSHVKTAWLGVVLTVQALVTALTYVAVFGAVWAPLLILGVAGRAFWRMHIAKRGATR